MNYKHFFTLSIAFSALLVGCGTEPAPNEPDSTPEEVIVVSEAKPMVEDPPAEIEPEGIVEEEPMPEPEPEPILELDAEDEEPPMEIEPEEVPMEVVDDDTPTLRTSDSQLLVVGEKEAEQLTNNGVFEWVTAVKAKPEGDTTEVASGFSFSNEAEEKARLAEEAKIQAEADATMKAEAEAAATIQAEIDAKVQAEQEAMAKVKLEEERKERAEQEKFMAQLMADKEKAEAEADKARMAQAEIEAKLKMAQEEQTRIQAEAKMAKEEQERITAEAEKAKQEQERIMAEAEKAKAEQARMEAEAEQARMRAVAEAERKVAAEAELQRVKMEAAAKMKKAEEENARLLAEAEAQRKAEVEAEKMAAAEAMKKAEAEKMAALEAQKKAEAAAEAKAAAEAMKKAEAEKMAALEVQKKAEAAAEAKATTEAMKKAEADKMAALEAQKKAEVEAMARATEALKKAEADKMAALASLEKAEAQAKALADAQAMRKTEAEKMAAADAADAADADEADDEEIVLAANTGPSSDLSLVQLEQDTIRDGVKGITVNSSANILGLNGKKVELSAYFYDKAGNPLKDTDKKYRSSRGQVYVGKESVVPAKQYTLEESLFLPYEQLDIKGNDPKTLQFELVLWDFSQSRGRKMAVVPRTDFIYTPPNAAPPVAPTPQDGLSGAWRSDTGTITIVQQGDTIAVSGLGSVVPFSIISEKWAFSDGILRGSLINKRNFPPMTRVWEFSLTLSPDGKRLTGTYHRSDKNGNYPFDSEEFTWVRSF